MSGTDTHAKIIDRIRKLLRMGASPNAHEASAAIAKAQALMHEHGIDQIALDLAAFGAAQSNFSASHAARPPRWDTLLRSAVCNAFGVRCLLDWRGARRLVSFYGERTRSVVAAYAYQVLGRQCGTSRAKYFATMRKSVKRTTRIARADHFAEAWIYAASRNLDRLRIDAREEALIEQFADREWGQLQEVKSRAAKRAHGVDNAAVQGYVAGRNARLDVPIAGSSARVEAIGHG